MAAFVVHAIVKQAITFATRYVGDDEDLMDEQIDYFRFYSIARLTAFAKYPFIRHSAIDFNKFMEKTIATPFPNSEE